MIRSRSRSIIRRLAFTTGGVDLDVYLDLDQHQKSAMAAFSTSLLFTDKSQAQLYAKCRPVYPDAVFQRIFEFCRKGKGDFQLAVDVGCGSGQSTVPLSKLFKQVIGVDVSEQQIANAPSDHQNIKFYVSPADTLPFVQTASVDLLTIAQALHWMDLNKFFLEVDRVLKPGGSLVAYGYGLCQVEPKTADGYFQHIYSDVLGKFWAPGRKMVEEKYSSLSLPYPGWERDDSHIMETVCNVDDLVGYIGSWSALTHYKKANPDDNLLERVKERLQHLCPANSEGERESNLRVIWPVFMLMGQKPLS